MLLTSIAAAVVAVVMLVLWLAARRSFASAAARRDAAEQRLAELWPRLASAETAETGFLQILNGLGEGLIAIDRQRRVVLANRQFISMFEVARESVGRPLGEVVRIAAVFDAFDASSAGSEATDRFVVRIGGAERTYEMRTFPLHAHDIAAVGIFIDVTRVVHLEDLRRDFISDFSHEARTPLTALKSAVESYDLAAGHMREEEEQQLRRIMSRQIARLARLIEDLSELTRIESGDLRLSPTDVDLRKLIEDLCEDFGERAARKRLRLQVLGDAIHLAADPMRIQQALGNLLDNAIKYGAANSTVEIDLADAGSSAVIRVTDHGEGIAADEKEKIFRRFYRVDKSRSQEVAGSGLGLAITKHLILQHGGTIEVESEPGSGATFIVKLPKGAGSVR